MVATAASLIPSGAAVASAKKAAAKSAAAKKPRAKPNHPRTAEMVDAAIVALKEKGGSSLQAIKKYITGTYAIDAEKLSPFIKKYLKSSVVAKKLVQTKGKGASGSFRLGGAEGGAGSAAAVAKKRTVAKKAGVKKSPAKPKKKTTPKKKVLKSVAAKPPKAKAAKKPKAAKKAKKPKKAAAAKK